jgi:hypothetical protein
MTEAELRVDIAAFDAGLHVDWIGQITDSGDLEAVVSDGWGQYRWPWLRTAAETHGAPYTEGVGRPAWLAAQRDPATRKKSMVDVGTIPPPVAIPPAAPAASPRLPSRAPKRTPQLSLFQ